MWYLGVCLDGMTKYQGTLSKGNLYTDPDPNQILSDYEILAITCVLFTTMRPKKSKHMTGSEFYVRVSINPTRTQKMTARNTNTSTNGSGLSSQSV